MLKPEPGMKWHGEGETEPTGNSKLALAITKNGKMAAISLKIIIQQNSQLLYRPPPSIVNRNRILVLAIMNKWKNGYHFAENHPTAKFQITDLPKFGSPLFPSINGNRILVLSIMKKWPPFHGKSSHSKIPNY